MRIGVPKETAPGEARVALVPSAVAPLLKAGLEVVVEASAGDAAGFPDEAYRTQGASVASRAEVFQTADVLLQVRSMPAGPCAEVRSGRHRIRRPAGSSASRQGGRGDRRDDAVDGAHAAHHACAEHGCALVDGDRRRLQGRPAGGESAPPHVPDAHDGGRHRLASACLHCRGRRRRATGNRVGSAAWRPDRGVRRATSREGAGPEPWGAGS